MSVSSGPWYIDDVLTFYQTAHDPATGGAVDADAVPDYRVYEVETGTAILTGSMALLDSGNTTGLYSESITLSAANGFEVGKSYCVYRTVVVGGVTDTAEDSFKVIDSAPGSGPSAADIADAVLEELLTDHDSVTDSLAAGIQEIRTNVQIAIANILTLSTYDPAVATVDGITYESAFEFILAVLGGVAAPSGSDVAFKLRDGTTTKVTITYGGTDGERTASVIS